LKSLRSISRPRSSKKSIARSRGLLLAPVLLGLATFAQPAYAVPVTLTLDNPHQTIAHPGTGEIVLNFTGTVSFDHDFHFEEAELDFAYNRSSTSAVSTAFGPVDFSDANNGGSVTAVLFTAEISSLTAPDLYAFEFETKEPATLSIEGANDETFATVMRSFSIRVTNGTAVPEKSSSALLFLGVSFVSFVVFECRQWGQCARSRRFGKAYDGADAPRLKALP
jgi:hypothetical protein